jgi:hypothetical protein
MKKFIYSNSFTLSLITLLVGLTFSCSSWDDYKKYSEGGEIVYPGKVQAVEILSGEERVQVMGSLGPDPRVVSIRVFWNDYTDSLEIVATDEVKASGFDQLVTVEEGLRTFVFHTYDESGNRSLAVNKIGVSYGDRYRAKVHNRVFSSMFETDSSTLVIWRPIDTSTGAQYVDVSYTVDGNELNIQTPVTIDTTELIGLTSSDMIYFRTIYLPSEDCIDLFYSALDSVSIER